MIWWHSGRGLGVAPWAEGGSIDPVDVEAWMRGCVDAGCRQGDGRAGAKNIKLALSSGMNAGRAGVWTKSYPLAFPGRYNSSQSVACFISLRVNWTAQVHICPGVTLTVKFDLKSNLDFYIEKSVKYPNSATVGKWHYQW